MKALVVKMVVATENVEASAEQLQRILRDAGWEVAIYDMAIEEYTDAYSAQDVAYEASEMEQLLRS